MITFDDLWNFIETTYVTEDVLHIIDHYGRKISFQKYILYSPWEMRFNIDKLKSMWNDQYTFIVHSSRINSELSQLIYKIERDNNVSAHAHIYAGKLGSKSFSIHADNPDNLIIQCIGKSKVTIYNEYSEVCGEFPDANVTIKEQFVLEPGNSIYIPSLQFHLFEPLTDRLSVSIPMIKNDY
jgi:hypothetical protein